MRNFNYHTRFTSWTWTLASVLTIVIIFSGIMRVIAMGTINTWWDNLIVLLQTTGFIVLGLAVLFRIKD